MNTLIVFSRVILLRPFQYIDVCFDFANFKGIFLLKQDYLKNKNSLLTFYQNDLSYQVSFLSSIYFTSIKLHRLKQ